MKSILFWPAHNQSQQVALFPQYQSTFSPLDYLPISFHTLSSVCLNINLLVFITECENHRICFVGKDPSGSSSTSWTQTGLVLWSLPWGACSSSKERDSVLDYAPSILDHAPSQSLKSMRILQIIISSTETCHWFPAELLFLLTLSIRSLGASEWGFT